MLWFVNRYPHPSALARRAGGGLFGALGRLEARGLVTRRHGAYRITRRGRDELAMSAAVTRLLVRSSR